MVLFIKQTQNPPKNVQRTDYFLLFWSLFLVCQWSLPNYFASRTQKTCGIIFFLSSRQMRSHTHMRQMNPPNDWLKTGWTRNSQARPRLVDSLFCITCSIENNAFSVLDYVIKVTLHYYMLHRFEIFSPFRTFAHGSIRLPPSSLTSLRGCLLAIILQLRLP